MSNIENSKRIALNTALLYFRMLISMGVSLYTSRIVLNTLGVEDFGIYNVVGGVVMMFSFLNASMSTATQRFLSFEIGKKNLNELEKTFSMSINIHVIIAIFVFIFAETIGLWFLNHKLVIPIYRLEVANWVYQFSVFSLMVSIIRVPFNSLIIAHERMKVFAYVSIFEAILKLLLVLLLIRLEFDKLQMYSILIFIVTIIVCLTYWLYCNNNFKNTRYIFCWKNKLFKTLISYGGWNLFGGISGVAMQNGLNILLNLFFGPIVNAARAISFQVNATVNGFVSSFQIAMYPQIVKSYAKDEVKYMHKIIFQGSKYSFYLLLFVTLPILMETESVLTYWLGIVPEYTVLFCRLVLINSLIDCISGPLMSATQATGKIKAYQA
ncbi:MATE family efflux transporter, partial [Akkermansiaceae bacterium]|nr:MATE family efflux transporter [Akkermansiaceae bacterium]